MPTAREIADALGLAPLPEEGGLYRQTYVADETIAAAALPPHYGRDKAFSTAIYYLLTGEPDSFSALHRLPTDEVYHFYLGDPVELLELHPDGTRRRVLLGPASRSGGSAGARWRSTGRRTSAVRLSAARREPRTSTGSAMFDFSPASAVAVSGLGSPPRAASRNCEDDVRFFPRVRSRRRRLRTVDEGPHGHRSGLQSPPGAANGHWVGDVRFFPRVRSRRRRLRTPAGAPDGHRVGEVASLSRRPGRLRPFAAAIVLGNRRRSGTPPPRRSPGPAAPATSSWS